MALTLKQALAMFWEQIQVRFVKRENGKGLSTNDFTNEEKNKLASLENATIDTTLTVSNAAADAKAVGDALAEKQPVGDYALKIEISSAIVDVTVLPETGEPDRLYRLLTGTFYWEGGPFATSICYIVEQFPETGTPATNADMSRTWMYYSLETQTLMGYIDEMLSVGLGVPVGWYPAETLFQVAGLNYGGIVFDPADATEQQTMYLVLEGVLYEYADRWIMLNQVGWRGGGNASEIFNSLLNVANGNYSHAEGFHTVAGNIGSHAEGYSSHAEGDSSHAEGYSSHAEGDSSHAEGDYSHAEGYSSHAEGDSSHAEGGGKYVALRLTGDANATVYTNNNSLPSQISVGMTLRMQHYSNKGEDGTVGVTYTTAKVTAFDTSAKTITVNRTLSEKAVTDRYTIGYYAGMALSDYTHVEGNQNIAAGKAQHVEGEFNKQDPQYNKNDKNARGKYVHVVGNGTNHENRSNAHALDWNGNAYYAGDVYVTGDGKNDFAGSKKLATEDFVTAALTALGLPVPTAADAGKILRVNAQGKYELVSIANAEEATF